MKLEWPFILKSKHRAVQVENFTLRSALKEANAELSKYRRLVGGLSQGQEEVTRQFERVVAAARKETLSPFNNQPLSQDQIAKFNAMARERGWKSQ